MSLAGLKGDKALWVLLLLLGLFSFLPVFSAASNLAYTLGQGTPFSHLIKHIFILVLGFGLMFVVHNLSSETYRKLAWVGLLLSFVLLVLAALQNTIIGGAVASRWIVIPYIGMTIQPSTLALLALMIFCAHVLTFAKFKGKPIPFMKSIYLLWIPMLAIVGIIIPFDLSTAALIFLSAMLLLFISGYKMKHFVFVGLTLLVGLVIVFYVFQFNLEFNQTNRYHTWKSRVEGLIAAEDDQKNYQIVRSKAAIASGKIIGVGPGKSRIKNILPQSTSDFIYAIIVEEYGFIGGVLLLGVYFLILFRIVVIAYNLKDPFKKLLVIGVGVPIIIQAFLNIAVSLHLIPVTGLPLPLMSMGGTSIWVKCIAFGIILGMSQYAQNKNAFISQIKGI
ncbi:MAG: FtsW/RodA/SpoVE family cell cycle protein [Flavobacteriaceae bacterium]|nr:FtsW/RodA/SpoVE family cell cycle protein [Flavobacteriaceae bacterium]MCY4268197.1 FtsW/RodA/SpoVE family cell cycle protein [Flavobacteriaceae bacterium]MCY4300088.1 FtsW/RodA/SpoVE family cell cycle protein [Flavobacteriaceae bacterium]